MLIRVAREPFLRRLEMLIRVKSRHQGDVIRVKSRHQGDVIRV